MKTIEQAEKLICPFMSTIIVSNEEGIECNRYCITNQCMAWITTKTHEHIEKKPEDFVQGSFINTIFEQGDKLPREKCEGFCLRLRR